ncbi:hypothetical protein PInf_013541 [Phytophthora infestans]|nr:hypothetical protein PInf_013541 [Phytophthora infestans]
MEAINLRLAKQLAAFSSEPSGRVRDEAKEANATVIPTFSQGDEAMKITRVGMYVNVAMAATKGAVGLAIHSNALIADAAHSLSDLLSDVVTLWSVKVARLPPDPKHPYGYGKYEAVGSLSVGAILVLCGLGIGADGFRLYRRFGTALVLRVYRNSPYHSYQILIEARSGHLRRVLRVYLSQQKKLCFTQQ